MLAAYAVVICRLGSAALLALTCLDAPVRPWRVIGAAAVMIIAWYVVRPWAM